MESFRAKEENISATRKYFSSSASVSVLPAEFAGATVLGQVDGVALNDHLAHVGHVADQADQIGLTACSK